MKAIATPIEGLLVIEPTVFKDDRGFFYESFNQSRFNAAVGYRVDFVQDNHSRSTRNVLRGLHFQVQPHPQGKLVRAVTGAVFDVAVDIRPQSPTFGQSFGIELSAENHKQLWIPAGFAHGFMVLSEAADFLYKTTHFWNKDCERAIVWNDPDLNIQWPLDGAVPIVAEKDAKAATFQEVIANPANLKF